MTMTTGAKHSFLDELDHIASAASLVFAQSNLLPKLLSLISRTRADLRDALDQRQAGSNLIAVCGSKNSGKSWLCRALISSKEKRELIRSGFDQANSTTRVTWIGPEQPIRIEPEFEQFVPVAAAEMADLGLPYLLLDVPGYNDLHEGARQAAKRCVSMANLRVFITSIRTLHAEENFYYLAGNDGATILPLIVDPKFPRGEEVGADVKQFLVRLQKACPASEVLAPVFIPQFDLAQDPGESENVAERLAEAALRDTLPKARRNLEQIVLRIRTAFRAEFKEVVDPVFAHIRPHFEALREAEEQVAGTILGEIGGTDRQLFSGVRLQMLAIAANSAPLLFFPFRSFLGLLAMTAGAWDRLALGLSGSVPSLALAAFQGMQNLRASGRQGPSQRERLKKRIKTLAQSHLETPARIFSRAVEQSGAGPSVRAQGEEGTIRVEGVDWMIDESFRRMQEIIENHRPAPRNIFIGGLLASLLFWGLLAGPIVAVYRHFLRSWSQVFADSQSTWALFPTPSGAMIFTTVLLVTIPVFMLALVTLSLAVRKTRVTQCAQAVKASHEQLRQKVTQERRIWIATDDPGREAISRLLLFAEDSPSATKR